MSELGAQAAYRGYRLQALYVLYRILSGDNKQKEVFHLEGNEDLAVEIDNKVTEITQVKSYDPLILSALSPKKENSFFTRVLDQLNNTNPPKIQVVNFGPIGEEMRLAWLGIEKHRMNLSSKLLDYGFCEEEITRIFERIELISMDEIEIENKVTSKLQELIVGIDPINAFDLLNYWIYLVSEKKGRVNQQNLLEKIINVGTYLSESYVHHKEWFTTIQPLVDYVIDPIESIELKEEFFAGISTNYEHILAGLDFYREVKINEISLSFANHNVVILHAASGQGKSTLAYRYLHEMYPSQFRFLIKFIENRQHASSIALALASHAKAIQSPMAIFIDVSPSDEEWPELVKQISHNKYLQILVAIREEDFHRANISNAFDYGSVDLSFERNEAKKIYDRVILEGYQPTQLDFDSTWQRFGGKGPLMEFIYLLTQTQTLKHRLEEQIKRIQIEIREGKTSPDELALLRLVAVATAFDARVNLQDLVNSLNLPEPALTISILEKEYLLRVSPDNHFLIGLHPLRSKIIVEILTDQGLNPWSTITNNVIQFIPEEDWELFFLQAFSEKESEIKELLTIITNLNPLTIIGLGGVLRCLLWVGIKKYIEENWSVTERARELFGQAWYFILDFNFAGEEALTVNEWWRELSDQIPKEKQEQIEINLSNQSPKEQAFILANTWLKKQKGFVNFPDTVKEWKSFAEVLYWASRWGISKHFVDILNVQCLNKAILSLPLIELSEFSFSFYLANKTLQMNWITENKAAIEERLSKELQIMTINESEGTLILHFLTYPEDNSPSSVEPQTHNDIHDETIERIQIVRQLFPQYSKYGSQGYGHQISSFGILHDKTTKTGIPAKSLPPYWPIRLNSISSGLVQYKHRLENWDEYIKQVIERRSLLIDCLNEAITGITNYIRRDKPYNLLKIESITSGKWDTCREQINYMPILPKQAVDRWGFSQPENNTKRNTNLTQISNNPLFFIADQRFSSYLEIERAYFSSMEGFLDSSISVMLVNYKCGKLPEESPQKQSILRSLESEKIKTNLAKISLYDIEKANDSILTYQHEFRILFDNRIDIKEISRLEVSEINTISLMRVLWYYFALFPRTTCGEPRKTLTSRMTGVIQGILTKYDQALELINSPSIRARRIGTPLFWNNSPTVWINIDFDDPIDIYKNINSLLLMLRSKIGPVDIGELDYKLIEENYKYTVIIPTIRGKMINSLVYPLMTTFTLISDEPIENKIWAYVPQEMPSLLTTQLHLTIWESPKILRAFELSSSIKLLGQVLNFLLQIDALPDPNSSGTKYLDGFMERRSKDISELLQTFIDRSADILEEFNNLTEDNKIKRLYFSHAVELLIPLYEQIIPSNITKGSLQLNLKELLDFSLKIQNAILPIEEISLFLITDAIEEFHQ